LRKPVPSCFPSAREAACALALAVSVAGCATVQEHFPRLASFGVYKLDINQGNYLSQDLIDKLRVGQTKQQVKTILGTPLVTSVFHADRWDYLYEFERQGRVVEHRKFTAYFVDDKLARWEGDEMPQSVAELNRAAAARALSDPKPADKSFWDRMLDVFRGQ
jgi:outer membrane protein assembly factor BamE